MTDPPTSGRDKAMELAERSILTCVLCRQGEEIPEHISRLLDFSPNSFEHPLAGQVALAIKQSRNNGKAPDLISVLSKLSGESVDFAQELANATPLPMALANLDAEPLLLRWRSRKLIAVLGESWEEARSHPDKAKTIGRIAIDSIKSVMAEMPEADLPPITDSAIFAAMEIPPSPEIIKGILHKGAKMVIGGGSKSFKTWVQLHLAICIAYGLDWLGFKTTPGRVLFVNFEIQEEFFQQRVRKISESLGITPEEGRLDIWNLRGKSASYDILVPKIIERIREVFYVLSILDPVYKLYGKTDENSASDVAQLLNSFEGLTVDTGSAVGFGAHYSKGNQSAKESIDRVSGSGVFARDPDSIINFTKHEEKDAFTVEPILRNLPPVEPFVVRWKFPLMVRDDDLDPCALKQPGNTGRKKEYEPAKLLSFIARNTKESPISISEWAELASIPRKTLSDYLPEMRFKGWITTLGEGRCSRQAITPSGVIMATGGN